ncbi:MAG: NADH-quinone oxidoreductase subunit NuoF [Candidatus Eremiobacteraeota bacterium]|nr:NADH-quinone oxidoreductase subunit NuoF [Candidatus Eremiobacteraeota bacterium]
MVKIKSPEDLASLTAKLQKEKNTEEICITVCMGPGCLTCGSQKVLESLKEEIKKRDLQEKVQIKETGCHGFCQKGPILLIKPAGIFYQQVIKRDIPEIITETIINNRIVERLLYVDPILNSKIIKEKDVPFYKSQYRLVFGDNSLIDPHKIDDYISLGGYSALAKALFEMTPVQVMEEIKNSGLRGRGGGGFHTGRKWESCRNAPSPDGVRYVICNADEGDPGAFMDRGLLEGNPHRVIEGMIIGAYAISSNEGYAYVRNEYPLAVANLNIALELAREYGLLGKDIMGSGFDFDILVVQGGGAFVCGESTALMASIEGKRGEPRPKHIHTSERGLWNKPTALNNVETWANVPIIIKKGAEWFSQIGTERSKGTKIFSLVGKINNTGLVEVPMGISLRDIVYKIGGGIPDGKKFKAIQTGGPSGGCLPEELLDLPVDFDELTKVGSMMGSGGMIVMDENTCMVDIAKYFLKFLRDESCGKCVPCREGLKRMVQIIEDITEGKGEPGHLELLEELTQTVKEASLCGLGKTAPNPVLSTIRYFRDEYEAHIMDKKCPALVCKNLIEYSIDELLCTGCGSCKRACPVMAISGEKLYPHTLDMEKCIKCGICLEKCPFDAIKIS